MAPGPCARLPNLNIACLVFGYLQILASVALTMTAVWAACLELNSPNPILPEVCPRLVLRILFTITVLLSATTLVKGVHKRKEGYVLGYFIFGVVATVGLVIAATLFAVLGAKSSIACTIFLLIVVYALCLSMVCAVYRNMKLEKLREHGPAEMLQQNCVDDHDDGAKTKMTV